MAHTLAIVNRQNGVGKTTTALGIARALTRKNKKVLLVCMDPLSTIDSKTPATLQPRATLYECMMGRAKASDCIVTMPEGVDLLPATPSLVGYEIDALRNADRDIRLADVLDDLQSELASAPMSGNEYGGMYDHIIVDTPASLGTLTVNALVAATDVLIPLRCDYFASEGIGTLLTVIDVVQEEVNPELQLRGFLATHVDLHARSCGRNLTEIRKIYGDMLLPTYIPEGEGMEQSFDQLIDQLFSDE